MPYDVYAKKRGITSADLIQIINKYKKNNSIRGSFTIDIHIPKGFFQYVHGFEGIYLKKIEGEDVPNPEIFNDALIYFESPGILTFEVS